MTIGSRTKLFVAGMLLISTGVVGFAVFWGMSQISVRFQKEDLNSHSSKVGQMLSVAFDELGSDVAVLGSLNVAREVLEGGGESRLSDLKDLLRTFMEQKSCFSQMRLIGLADGGREALRFERLGEEVILTDEADLQRKGDRDYFRESIAMDADDLYFSEVNLNRERGEIQQPYVATIRIAKQVRSESGQLLGILVANVFFDAFISRLLGEEIENYELFLANEDGFYLFHRDESRRFGFELSHNSRVQLDVPESEAFFSDRGASGTFGRGGLLQFAYRLTQLQRLQLFDDSHTLVLGMASSYSNFSRESGLLTAAVLGIVAVFVFLGLALTRFLALGVTRPLEAIVKATDRFAMGSTRPELPIGRKDEIGDLARSFSDMRSSVAEQQRRVVEMNKRLEAANLDLDHFAHIATHELREPINRIAIMADLALSGLDPISDPHKAPVVELLDSLYSQSRQLLQQITDFRRFSELGSGPLVRGETDIEQLIRATLEDFPVELERCNAKVEIEPMPVVQAYSTLLAVVYGSLTDNALRFAQGDSVSLRFTCEKESGRYVFGVSNSGSSIDEKDYETIFKPLVSISAGRPASGMGLSICKKIIDRHSGVIWVESENFETHFKFTLGVDADKKDESTRPNKA